MSLGLTRENIEDIALNAMLDEVHTTVKPGLVDMRNTGAHSDMDVYTFEKSALALAPFFGDMFEAGRDRPEDIKGLFKRLREIGIEAEKAMYSATLGVNTHKGILFSMGILCGALGAAYGSDNIEEEAFAIAGKMGELSLLTDFSAAKSEDSETAGETQHRIYGLRGIRGEVADGFPALRQVGYKNFLRFLKTEERLKAGEKTLIYYFACLKDSNVIKRGGISEAKWLQDLATEHILSGDLSEEWITELDDLLISKNISPGGAADQLILTYFWYDISTLLLSGEA